MPQTRQSSSQMEDIRLDMKEAIQSELRNFFKSSGFREIFAEVAKTLITQSVEEATRPLLKRIEDLEVQLKDNAVKANENEQYSRKYNLRISGLDETEGEDCVQKICDFCEEKLDVSIDKSDVDRAHRIGSKHLDKKRSLIIKFKNPTIRKQGFIDQE